MRSSISFLSVLFLSGLVAALAQDVNMQSDSEDGVLLNVENTGTADKTAVRIVNNITEFPIGVDLSSNYLGINAITASNNGSRNTGIYSEASQVHTDGSVFGITSQAWNADIATGVASVAGFGYSANYGVYAEALGGFGNNYGIYASAHDGGTNMAGYFEGDVAITGYCYPCEYSDERLKTNVRGLVGALNKVMALRPKAYEMKVEEFKDKISMGHGTQFGLIAQDVQSVVPEVVHDIAVPKRLTKDDIDPKKKHPKKAKQEAEKYKGLNYTALIPVMLAAMQEQQAQIEALKAEVASLKK